MDGLSALALAAEHLRARRWAEAEAAATALAAHGDPGALHLRAEARLGRGALDEAADDLDAALGGAPFSAELWTTRADLELWRAGLPGWEAVVDGGLVRPVLPPGAYHLLVRKAALCWMRGDHAACAAVLEHLSAALARDGQALADRLRGYTMSTAVHLRGLLAALRAGRAGRTGDAAPVFLLGDSHCVAPAGTLVPVAGRTRRVVPLYVLGLKAWHLAAPYPNPYRAGAERAASSAPPGAPVIVSAGDIDCRPHSGFDNLRRRGHADLPGAIRATAEGYLDWVCARLPGRAAVLAPPAQRLDHVPPGDRPPVAVADARFRAALAEGCAARSVPLLDYGGLTLRPDGTADPRFYVDAHHLSADALATLLCG